MSESVYYIMTELLIGRMPIDDKTIQKVEGFLNNEYIELDTKIQLLKLVGNVDLARKCLHNKDLPILSKSRLDIIISTGDIEFYKECIEDYSNGLNKEERVLLVIKTKDVAYIKMHIEKNILDIDISQQGELVVATGDSEYIKQYFEYRGFLLDSTQKADLLIATKDSEYIKENLANQNNLFLNEDKVKMILAVGDLNYIDECLENEELGLNEENKINLIIKTKNIEYIKKYVEDDKLHFTRSKKIVLLLHTFDDEYIHQKLMEYNIINQNSENDRIMLPSGMTIGVEIESIGVNSNFLRNFKYKGWTGDFDISIPKGVEIKSPKPFTEDYQDIKESLYEVNNILRACIQTVSKGCAGHIHIGADYLTSTQSWINLVYLLESTEYVLYLISNKEGIIPRSNVVGYAIPLSEKLLEKIEDGEIDVNSLKKMKHIVDIMKKNQNNRKGYSVNFLNVGSRDMNTIEFRMANGTLDPEQWADNINLFAGIVKTAEEISHIQMKPEEEMTSEEKKKLQLFDELSGEMTEEERAHKLLDLVISGDKKSYMKKFVANKKLADKDIFFSEWLSRVREASSKIQINPTMIARRVFVGNGATDGVKVREAENIIQRLRENERKSSDAHSGEDVYTGGDIHSAGDGHNGGDVHNDGDTRGSNDEERED